MKLPHTVTFTGADERTDLSMLARLAAYYPEMEIAVLLWTPMMGQPLYPTFGQLKAFGRNTSIPRKALHVCGVDVETLLAWEKGSPVRALVLDGGYKRIQLNFDCRDQPGITAAQIDCFCERLGEHDDSIQVITQYNDANAAVVNAITDANHRLLMDSSLGRGILPATWAAPPEHMLGLTSWAGGLSPENIAQQLPLIAAVAQGQRYGVDLQSGVIGVNGLNPAYCRNVLNTIEALR